MIRYSDSAEDVTPDMLRGFFHGWKSPRTPEMHLAILKKSAHVVLALDDDAHRVAGFVTALTDGVEQAFIPLLEVLPEYRHQGIGTELVTRMLGKLEGIPAVDLTCDPDMQGFYARFGMKPSVGMMIRRQPGGV